MYQRREYDNNEQISCGFKASGKLAAAINQAAEKAKSPSKAHYLMHLVADWVAADIGVPASTLIEPEPVENTTHQEAIIAMARLQQTIADAQMSLDALRTAAAPRRAVRSVSGMVRKAG